MARMFRAPNPAAGIGYLLCYGIALQFGISTSHTACSPNFLGRENINDADYSFFRWILLRRKFLAKKDYVCITYNRRHLHDPNLDPSAQRAIYFSLLELAIFLSSFIFAAKTLCYRVIVQREEGSEGDEPEYKCVKHIEVKIPFCSYSHYIPLL